MAILGSFNAGLKQDYELLFTKSLLDGISSCMLSVSLGLGVLFSSVPVFVYQGLLALLAHVIAPLLSERVRFKKGLPLFATLEKADLRT